VELPLLGRVPRLAVYVAAVLLAGYLLARALGWHAGLVGRRWAARLRRTLTSELEARLDAAAFGPLDGLETARRRLAEATAGARRDCRTEAPEEAALSRA
jgi:hypothetical protein